MGSLLRQTFLPNFVKIRYASRPRGTTTRALRSKSALFSMWLVFKALAVGHRLRHIFIHSPQKKKKSMWDSWWKKRHWERFFSEHLRFHIYIYESMIHTHILFPYNRRYTLTFIGQTDRPCSLKFTHARPKQTMLFLPGASTGIQSESTSGHRRRNWDLNAERQMSILRDFRLSPRSS